MGRFGLGGSGERGRSRRQPADRQQAQQSRLPDAGEDPLSPAERVGFQVRAFELDRLCGRWAVREDSAQGSQTAVQVTHRGAGMLGSQSLETGLELCLGNLRQPNVCRAAASDLVEGELQVIQRPSVDPNPSSALILIHGSAEEGTRRFRPWGSLELGFPHDAAAGDERWRDWAAALVAHATKTVHRALGYTLPVNSITALLAMPVSESPRPLSVGNPSERRTRSHRTGLGKLAAPARVTPKR